MSSVKSVSAAWVEARGSIVVIVDSLVGLDGRRRVDRIPGMGAPASVQMSVSTLRLVRRGVMVRSDHSRQIRPADRPTVGGGQQTSRKGGTAVVEPGISTATVAISAFGAPCATRDRCRQLADVAGRFGACLTAPYGDGVEAVFTSAAAAVGAAVAGRELLGRTAVTVRAGLASGALRWDHRRCSGPAVLTAARLAEQAQPGEILLTDAVALLAADGRVPLEPAALAGGPVGVDDQPVHLTARERHVLALVATGAGNRAIAEELFISPNTVANHLRSILTKIGCANRTEATVYALRHGLTRG
jgi:DNA-binding CsgD family transcriptional regulator